MSNQYLYTYTREGITTTEVIPLSTKLVLEQAEQLGVSWEAIPNTKIIKLTYQSKTRYFRWQVSPNTSFIGFHACLDKGETKALLQQAGVSTPRGFKLSASDSEETWLELFHKLGGSVVVKPSHGLQGQSIFMDIDNDEKYLEAVRKCFSFTEQEDAGVIVEQKFIGKEYRILTTRKKVLAAMFREPANVVGDGVKTIEALLAEKNADPRRGSDLNYALFKIEADEDLLQNLTSQNLSLTSVPKTGEKIFLRKVSNIMRGGDSIDVTDDIHPSVKEIAVKAVNAVPELEFVGVDFMTTDIFAPQTPDSYIIVEMNSSPGLCIHEFPYQGKKRYTDREFVYCAFPELAPNT